MRTMSHHLRAGERAASEDLVDLSELRRRYHEVVPNPAHPEERVAFGTSGHRGSSLKDSFQDLHVAALTQAIVELRKELGVDGPLFVGADSHALSSHALQTVREVLAAHPVDARFAPGDELVATPLISHAILQWNRDASAPRADGIILTPSHNPPQDGGYKYNPPSGGPAEPEITDRIAARANALLENPEHIRRASADEAQRHGRDYDFVGHYVRDLSRVIDLEAIQRAGVRMAVDPLGGAGLPVWRAIRDTHALNIDLLNETVDPQFGFMTLDHDGVIRMDCSSPFAMRGLVDKMEGYDVGVGNDPDADRHGIVTARGVMNPNHFLSLVVDHLLATRSGWSERGAIGRTVVTSGLLDRVAASHGREVFEVPVGFKWFVEGMFDGSLVFGGEESAGASFVDMQGQPWSTDKDGIILGLLAAEIIAKNPQGLDALWDALCAKHGEVFYARRDQPASAAARAAVKNMSPDDLSSDQLAGRPVTRIATTAQGNGASIGGLKIVTDDGWVAMRPSGTEDILKIYAESFVSEAHLQALLDDAEAVMAALVAS